MEQIEEAWSGWPVESLKCEKVDKTVNDLKDLIIKGLGVENDGKIYE